MKKYPKLVQCDSRGQIVIPKDIRIELGIDENTGFWVYSVSDEGILLKKVESPDLEKEPIVTEIRQKAAKIDLNEKSINKTVAEYKKTKEGNLDII